MSDHRSRLDATIVVLLSIFAATMGVARSPFALGAGALPADVVLAVALLAGLVAIGRALRTGARLDLLDGLAAAYVGWAAIDLFVDGVDRSGAWKLLGIAALAGLFIVGRTVVTDDRARASIAYAWCIGAVALSLAALAGSALALAHVPSILYSVRGGDLGWSFRTVGLANTSNMLAELLLVPLLVLVVDVLPIRARRPLLLLLGITFMLTLSRALLAFAFACGLRAWPRDRARAITMIVVASLATIVLFRLDVYRDDAGLRTGTTPGVRYRLAAAAAHTARAHPLFGVGPGRPAGELPWPRPDDSTTTMDAHMTPVNVAATLGFPALVCFVALCAGVVLRARQATGLHAALALALAAVFFDALTVDIEDFRHVWLLFALVAPRRN